MGEGLISKGEVGNFSFSCLKREIQKQEGQWTAIALISQLRERELSDGVPIISIMLLSLPTGRIKGFLVAKGLLGGFLFIPTVNYFLQGVHFGYFQPRLSSVAGYRGQMLFAGFNCFLQRLDIS